MHDDTTTPPSTQEHYRALERLYHGAPCNQAPGPRLRVTEGEAEVTMLIQESMHHAAHAVHGAWYFKLLDDAAYFAANSLVRDVFVLTASFTVELMRPVTSGPLRAVGRVTKPGQTLLFAASELFDAQGRLIARGTGTFARSQAPLTAHTEDSPT